VPLLPGEFTADRTIEAGGASDADVLLIGLASDAHHRELLDWYWNAEGLHRFVPDYHRLQLERWVWDHDLLGRRVLDIGAQIRRSWIGEGYATFGETNDVGEADIRGDLLDGLPEGWDVILCTEVLEHCRDPWRALELIRGALVPGGLLLASTPFFWPDHHTKDYPDFWRFTEQGWRLLLKDWDEVLVTATRWTSESRSLLDLARRFEGWGFRGDTAAFTGFLVEARA
jgi:SAM-dependent methyltransferase